jgi:excisionase family DNA binding protein
MQSMHYTTSEQATALSAPIKVLLTVDEAATALSLGRTFLYRLLMSKEIASVKVGRVRRIPVSALTEYVMHRLAE